MHAPHCRGSDSRNPHFNLFVDARVPLRRSTSTLTTDTGSVNALTWLLTDHLRSRQDMTVHRQLATSATVDATVIVALCRVTWISSRPWKTCSSDLSSTRG